MKRMMNWKQAALFVLLAVGVLFMTGCATIASQDTVQETVQADVQEQAAAAPTNVKETTLAIDDMTCVSCAQGVEYQLKQVPGVIDAKVSYKEGKGTIIYDADRVDPETIAKASDVYPARVIMS
ncbi:MAG: hypothetical protein GXP63_05855 [DPANN group archaeon]|nr:hypothetical protein [DPANN group archaeon]